MHTCLLLAFRAQPEDSLSSGESWLVEKVGIAGYITVGKCCVKEAQPKADDYLRSKTLLSCCCN